MAWITPKTNWVDGEYFNVTPDYNRIKSNIEFLINLANTMYAKQQTSNLQEADITTCPELSFFNNVVNATKDLLKYGYSPPGALPLRLYYENGEGWSAAELNIIENNHLLLYNAFTGQKEGLKRLQFILGGAKFGS